MESNWMHPPSPWRCLLRTSQKTKKIAWTILWVTLLVLVYALMGYMYATTPANAPRFYTVVVAIVTSAMFFTLLISIVIAMVWDIDWPPRDISGWFRKPAKQSLE